MSVELRAPVDELRLAVSAGFSGPRIDLEILRFLGIFILRRALSEVTTQHYRDAYHSALEKGKIQKAEYHKTFVDLMGCEALINIVADPEFCNPVSVLFGGNVGADFVRVVKKDGKNFEPFFLHQDTGYQVGGFERFSCFIALTKCTPLNGGLILYPGTHHYGYLGDAGEIKNLLPSGYPRVAPTLEPGDILIMHSGTWHESHANHERSERIYLEVHVQHVDEPTTRWAISGVRQSPWGLHAPMTFEPDGDELFNDSRTQRIRRLRQQLESLESRHRI